MILIADCGSTKIDWCLLNGNEKVAQIFTTGMNALLLTQQEMTERIHDELMPHIVSYKVDEIYYYGAGIISDEIKDSVRNALKANIPTATKIEVDTDLLAAARALCGREPGIACILGTGSNSCYYDGEKVVDNVSPLGYILGDEGSGAVLGKLLVGDVLKKQLPEHLCQKFLDEYNMDRTKIINAVYRQPAANRFLAQFAPFLERNIDEPAIHDLVLRSFTAFFVRNVESYDGYKQLPCNFVGSIALKEQKVLREAAAARGITIGNIIQNPMEGLVKYHSVNA
ncbi:MAG: ATPase [Muribaculaceae bacterium]|jgi:N-acetylglucosamine kinase-like BadF-type ATPase|nr:ATPase [Muribaculaceae bacterium]